MSFFKNLLSTALVLLVSTVGTYAVLLALGQVQPLNMDFDHQPPPAPSTPTSPADFTPAPGYQVACLRGRKVKSFSPQGNDMAEYAAWVCHDPDNNR